MASDAAIFGLVVVALAVLATAHVALAFGLARRGPWWRGAVALAVPPLAPYWGLHERMRLRSMVWLGALVVYGAAFAAASLGG